MNLRFLAAMLSACLPVATFAQTPPGWRTVSDQAPAGTAPLAFETMAPGWHVTAGPSAILFDPANTASGTTTVAAEFFLFTSTPGSGFGVLIGGQDLDATNARYTALIVGPDGRYRVMRRDGSAVRDLVSWTTHEAIAKHPGGDANVKQTVSITSDDRVVRIAINGTAVTELPRSRVQPEGIVGFRIDPGVNVHAATLVLGEKNVAPVRPK